MKLPQTPIEKKTCHLCGAIRYSRHLCGAIQYSRHWTNAEGQPQGNAHRACPECGSEAGVTKILD